MKYLIFTFLMAGHLCAFSQIESKIDSLMNSQVSKLEFSGAVLITKNNKVLVDKSFGYADLKAGVKIDGTTKFSIGSISKMMTASLIFRLIEAGKLKLNEPIDAYLSEWKIPNGNKITLHHLLTHSGGLGEYIMSEQIKSLEGKQPSLDDFMKIIASLPLAFSEPGSKFQYSNSGFIVMGKIIEKMEGKPYFDVVREVILKPAKMKNSTHLINLSEKSFAKGYMKEENGSWTPNLDIIPPASDGGMFCTAKDLLLFDQALNSEKIISKQSLETMRTQQMGPAGYATIISKTKNGIGYGHNGGLPGYQADYRHYYFGKDEYTVVVFSNKDRMAIPVLSNIQSIIDKSYSK